ncbi:MAG TPA: ABC transporter permease subunit [Actinocrinis sp.]|jgi:ABC-type transport system involved in multi-copper enzyme maturation permease subunit
MTAQTINRGPGSLLPALPEAHGRAGLGGTLASEWTKIRSVRSTMWSLLFTVLIVVGLGALLNWANSTHEVASGVQLATHEDLVQRTLGAIILGQLVMVVFGAMAVTTEYSTGMIRTSLSAQPRRMDVFWAKLIVVAAVSLVVGEVVSFASFLVSANFWHGRGVDLTLGSPGALQAVAGGGLYLAGTALLSFGFGALLRHTAGAIVTGVFLVFVVDILENAMPQSWQDHVDKWLPPNAGTEVWATRHIPGVDLGSWTGFLVFMLYAVGAILLGAIRFKRSDA